MMMKREWTARRFSRLGLLAVFGLAALLPQRAIAADHNDSPIVMGAARSYADITDVYLFRSPEDSSRLTIYVGHFSPEVAATPDLFRSDTDYKIFVDTNGDFEADTTMTFNFGAPAADGSQSFALRGAPGASVVRGTTTVGANAPLVTEESGVRAFAGLRDDPFFFDLDGFKHFVAAPCIPTAGLRCPGEGPPVNFFAGRNVAALVVDFPITALPRISSATSGVVRVWAKTFVPAE